MARTVLTPTYLGINGSVVNLTNAGTNFTAVDNTNGMTIPLTSNTIPAPADIDRLILVVLNTNGTGQTLTIRGATYDGGASKLGAGTAGGAYKTVPSFEGGKGDLTFSAMTLTTGIGIYGGFEVARFIQPDNSVSLDFSGATGFISAFFLVRAY